MDKTFYSGYILEVKTCNNSGLNSQTGRVTALEKGELEALLDICDLFRKGSIFAGNHEHNIEIHSRLNGEILNLESVVKERNFLKLSGKIIELKLMFFEDDWTRNVESVKVYYLNSPVTLYDVTERSKRPTRNSASGHGI
jgi:hypothetical protein